MASLEVDSKESHGKENRARFRGEEEWLEGARSIKSFLPQNLIKFLCKHHMITNPGEIVKISLN